MGAMMEDNVNSLQVFMERIVEVEKNLDRVIKIIADHDLSDTKRQEAWKILDAMEARR